MTTQEIYKQRIENATRNTFCGCCSFESDKHCRGCSEKIDAAKFADEILSNLWISVDESLPELDTNVWIMFEDGYTFVAYREETGWWRCDGFVCGTKTNGQPMYSSSCLVEENPTHWMPIPKIEKGGFF